MSSEKYFSQKELVEQAIKHMSTIQKQLSKKKHLSQNDEARQKYLKEMNKLLNKGLNKYYPNTKTN